MNNTDNFLSLASCLSALYKLSRHCHKNQVAFFKSLFATFHRSMSESQTFEYEPNQARVSQILRGRELLPRGASIFYMGPNGDEALRNDIEVYLSVTAVSHRQKRMYQQKLLDLVNDSDNLDPLDKEYILKYATTENSGQSLGELLFRMLHVLIREPLQASA